MKVQRGFVIECTRTGAGVFQRESLVRSTRIFRPWIAKDAKQSYCGHQKIAEFSIFIPAFITRVLQKIVSQTINKSSILISIPFSRAFFALKVIFALMIDKNHFNIEAIDHFPEETQRLNLYQVVYFREGSCQIKLDFDTFEVQAPCLLFVSEYQLLTAVGPNEIKGKIIRFANDFFCIKLNRAETFCDAVIFNSTKIPFVNLTDDQVEKFDRMIAALESECSSPSDYQEEIIISQLKTVLLSASNIKLRQLGGDQIQGLSKLITDFQNLLEDNYKKEHGVQFYADQFFITPKGLNNATKKELDKNASELIKEKLVIEAKRELYQNNKSVKEIAFELGFNDPAYFSRFFKKATGKTPKDFAEFVA